MFQSSLSGGEAVTIRERIEQLAGEWADATPSMVTRQGMVEHYAAAMTELLTDPAVGFKEALEWIANDGDSTWAESICLCYEKYVTEEKHDADCTCPCHTAKAKLDELKELEKGI